MSHPPTGANAADAEWIKRNLKHLKVSQLRELARSTRCGLGKLKADTLQNLFSLVDLLHMTGNSSGILVLRLLISLVQYHTALPPYLAIMNGVQNGDLNLQILMHQMSGHQMPSQLAELMAKPTQEAGLSTGSSSYRKNPTNILMAQRMNNADIKITFEPDAFHTQISDLSNFPQIGSGSSNSKCELYLKCRLTKEERMVLNSHENNGLFLYCAKLPDGRLQDTNFKVEYPQKMEIQVNGLVVTELSYRGLKNEVGSAKPVNLSKYIENTDNINHVKFTFVAAARYALYIKICRSFNSEELFQTTHFPMIDKHEDELRIRRNFENEDGISIDVEKISLNCPITYGRINVPMRGVNCDHLSCFDGLSYLALQEQISTWKCPFCQSRTPIGDLRISEYFSEVLKSVSPNTETVSIGKDCKWTELEYIEDLDMSDDEKPQVMSAKKENPPEEIEEIIILDSDEEDMETSILTLVSQQRPDVASNQNAGGTSLNTAAQHDLAQDSDMEGMENDILSALGDDSLDEPRAPPPRHHVESISDVEGSNNITSSNNAASTEQLNAASSTRSSHNFNTSSGPSPTLSQASASNHLLLANQTSVASEASVLTQISSNQLPLNQEPDNHAAAIQPLVNQPSVHQSPASISPLSSVSQLPGATQLPTSTEVSSGGSNIDQTPDAAQTQMIGYTPVVNQLPAAAETVTQLMQGQVPVVVQASPMAQVSPMSEATPITIQPVVTQSTQGVQQLVNQQHIHNLPPTHKFAQPLTPYTTIIAQPYIQFQQGFPSQPIQFQQPVQFQQVQLQPQPQFPLPNSRRGSSISNGSVMSSLPYLTQPAVEGLNPALSGSSGLSTSRQSSVSNGEVAAMHSTVNRLTLPPISQNGIPFHNNNNIAFQHTNIPMISPNGAVMSPNGTVITPAGAMITPTGTIIGPAGALISQTGAVVSPTGTVISSPGTVISSNGSAMSPTGAPLPIISPNGANIQTHPTSVNPENPSIVKSHRVANLAASIKGPISPRVQAKAMLQQVNGSSEITKKANSNNKVPKRPSQTLDGQALLTPPSQALNIIETNSMKSSNGQNGTSNSKPAAATQSASKPYDLSANAFNFRYTHNDRKFVYENQISLLRNKIEKYNKNSNPSSVQAIRDEELESGIMISGRTQQIQKQNGEYFDLTNNGQHCFPVYPIEKVNPAEKGNKLQNNGKQQLPNSESTSSLKKHPLDSADSKTPNKKNRTYGMLGLALDDDDDFSVSPLNGKIGEMSITTPQPARLNK